MDFVKNHWQKNLQICLSAAVFAVGFFAFSYSASAATQVYYSAGQNTSDHKTGTPTVTVSGTTATFSVAQTATNMGVGDVVTYAGGTCYISGKTSQTVWSCVSVTGGTPSPATNAAVTSIAHVFNSLNSAVAGASGASYLNTSNLVTGDYQLNIPVYYDTGVDNTAVNVTGYTTDATRFIRIYTPANISTEVNKSQRHDGKVGGQGFELDPGTDVTVMSVSQAYTVLDGLKIKGNSNQGYKMAIYLAPTACNGCIIANNLVYNWGNTSNSWSSAIYADGGNNTFEGGLIYNNIVIARPGIGPRAHGGISAVAPYDDYGVYNNTVYGFNNTGNFGIRVQGDSGHLKGSARNNISYGNTADFITTYSANADHNISSDASAIGTGSLIGQNLSNLAFVSTASGSEDLHMQNNSVAKDAGANLSGTFTSDIDGQLRPGTWDIGADETATNVYYSVGQSAADLKTGTPTVTISSGTATFSTAQTGNIGVGDRVIYNTSQIAYIAAKTHSDMTRWTLVTATGGVPIDVSGATVNSITHEFTSLSAAVAAASNAQHINNTDLTAANVVLNIPCYYDSGADTTAVTVSGYTTGANNYIKIYTPNNTSAEANNSQRHQGVWDNQKYRLDLTIGAGGNILRSNVPNIKIDGLQLGATFSGAWSQVVFFNTAAINYNASVSNSIVRNSGSAVDSTFGIAQGSTITSGTFYVWNNIFYGFKIAASGYSAGIFPDGTETTYAYNNTFYDCNIGIKRGSVSSPTVVAKNNVVQNTNIGFNGTFDASSANNISDHADAPGSNPKNSITVNFADVANKDFHLDPNDTAAKNAGADLNADANLPVTTDIDGQTRPTGANAVDIGADESATAVYYSVGQNTSDHKTGSPTLTISSGVGTFSVAQTATNMGVGDRVTYNGSTVAYIASKISTTQWKLITATGGTPADVAGQTVNSIAHAFNSLSAAEAGATGASYLNTADLVAGNYQLNFPCYYDSGADTTAVTVDGYATGISNYIRIYTPSNASTEANQSQRHQGKWSDLRYRIEISATADYSRNILQREDFVRIEGIQLKLSNNDYGYAQMLYNDDSWYPNRIHDPSADIRITDNIFWAVGSTTNNDTITGIYGAQYGRMKVINNLMYGMNIGGGGLYSVAIYVRKGAIVYNNAIYDAYRAIMPGDSSGIIAKNNVAQNGTQCFFTGYGTFDAASSNNISSDASAPGANSKINTTVSFVDAANKDFHLSPSDTAARNAGTNLQADANFAFERDIDGQARDGSWDIGADEFAESQIQEAEPSSSPSLENGLVGHWTFDGPDISGTTARDVSGNGNNGTINGATVADGKLGQGLNYATAGNTVTIPDKDLLEGMAQLTLSAWINPKTSGGGYARIIEKGNGYPYIFNLSGSNLQCEIGASSVVTTTSPLAGKFNSWHHVDCVYDGANISIYIDGVSVASTTKTGAVGIGATALTIGNNVAGDRAFDGRIDDVRIYNRALSAQEIGLLYKSGQATLQAGAKGPSNGLVGYWTFDGKDVNWPSASAEIMDVSGNGNHGDAVNVSTANVADGRIGQAVVFNGIGSYVSIPSFNSSSISISAWIKRSSMDTVNADSVFGGWYWNSNGQLREGYDLRFYINSNTLNWVVETTNGTNVAELSTNSGPLNLEEWYHVVANYDSSTGLCRLYINGVSVSSVSGFAGNWLVPQVTYPNMRIGHSRVNSGYFPGLIDDVRIYNRALSAGEISQLYKAGQATIRK